jgi:hypothetical protein
LGQKNSPYAEYARAFEYLNISDTISALNILNSITNSYSLNSYENLTHQRFISFIDTYKELVTLNGNIWLTDSSQLVSLETLSTYDNYLPGIFARNILIANGVIDYQETYQLPVELKSSGAIAYPNEERHFEKDEYLKIFPNPAKDFVIIEFSFPTTEAINKTSILLIDNKGMILLSILLNDVRNAIVVNTEGLISGVYYVNLINGNKIIDNTKLVIYD